MNCNLIDIQKWHNKFIASLKNLQLIDQIIITAIERHLIYMKNTF